MQRLLDGLGDAVDPVVVLLEDGPLRNALVQRGIAVRVVRAPERALDLRRADARRIGSVARAAMSAAGTSWRLARLLRSLKPDLVHANSQKAALLAIPACRIARVPLLWHVHDRIARDYFGRMSTCLLRIALRYGPDSVIANSQATRATLPVATRARVIGNALPDALLDAEPQVVRGPVRRVGVVGRLTAWKGQDLFVRAFARAFPEPGVSGSIIGSALFGEDDYERSVRDRVAALGMQERIEFRGFREDVLGELRRLDVLVHCSIVPEPFGQVIVEAMAAGVPVVAADAGGPRELITHGQDGLLYRPGDERELAEALGTMASDRDLRARIAASARERVHAFERRAIAAEVAKAYAELVP